MSYLFFPLAQIFPSFGSQLLSKKNIGQGGKNIISSPLDNRKKGEKDKAKSIYKKKGQLGKNMDKGEKISNFFPLAIICFQGGPFF